jgi:exodeoxyribonuclease VII small subunit
MKKTPDSMPDSDMTFEQAFERLSGVVALLEAGEGSLTERTRLFEEGMTLSRLCTERLESIEHKVEILLQNQQGQQEVVPYGDKEPG